MFAYSLRERTHAHHRMADNVDPGVKQRRLQEVGCGHGLSTHTNSCRDAPTHMHPPLRRPQIIDTFKRHALAANLAQRGRRHLVLVEGPSRRSSATQPQWQGRADSGCRVVFDDAPVAASVPAPLVRACDAGVPWPLRQPLVAGQGPRLGGAEATLLGGLPLVHAQPGDYVLVQVDSASHTTLYGTALGRTTLQEHAAALRSPASVVLQ